MNHLMFREINNLSLIANYILLLHNFLFCTKRTTLLKYLKI